MTLEADDMFNTVMERLEDAIEKVGRKEAEIDRLQECLHQQQAIANTAKTELTRLRGQRVLTPEIDARYTALHNRAEKVFDFFQPLSPDLQSDLKDLLGGLGSALVASKGDIDESITF